MGRTCLIFTIQLSPADLQLVREVLADIQTTQKKTSIQTTTLIPVNFLRLEGIIQDLSEIVLQSRTNEFKFNAYILKMTIVKLEFILSEIQLATDQLTLDIYALLDKDYKLLLKLFTNIIENI
jgi:hypothetical protein